MLTGAMRVLFPIDYTASEWTVTGDSHHTNDKHPHQQQTTTTEKNPLAIWICGFNDQTAHFQNHVYKWKYEESIGRVK